MSTQHRGGAETRGEPRPSTKGGMRAAGTQQPELEENVLSWESDVEEKVEGESHMPCGVGTVHGVWSPAMLVAFQWHRE